MLCNYPWRRGKIADVTYEVDHVRGSVREISCGLFGKQRRLGPRLNSAVCHSHGSSLTIGHVMQRAPPPPRTSSPPSNVITARSPSLIWSCPSRNAEPFTIL